MILVENGTFAWFQLVCDRPTDGQTDGPTEGRTDTPSYRDARTHLTNESERKFDRFGFFQQHRVSSKHNKKDGGIMISDSLVKWRKARKQVSN